VWNPGGEKKNVRVSMLYGKKGGEIHDVTRKEEKLSRKGGGGFKFLQEKEEGKGQPSSAAGGKKFLHCIDKVHWFFFFAGRKEKKEGSLPSGMATFVFAGEKNVFGGRRSCESSSHDQGGFL